MLLEGWEAQHISLVTNGVVMTVEPMMIVVLNWGRSSQIEKSARLNDGLNVQNVLCQV